MPAGLAGCGKVVGIGKMTGICKAENLPDDESCHICNEFCAGWRTELVGDHVK
ncbi:hypothetical protein D3C81_2275090 [compost metagenome]